MQAPGAALSVHHTEQNLNPHDAGLKATAPHVMHQPHSTPIAPSVQAVQPHFQKAHIAASHPVRAVPGKVM